MVLLARPPFDSWGHRAECRVRGFTHDAEQVDVGELSMEITGDSRTKKNHALQILSRCLMYPGYKFIDLFFWDHKCLFAFDPLPTAASAATAGTSPAKTAETTTPPPPQTPPPPN